MISSQNTKQHTTHTESQARPSLPIFTMTQNNDNSKSVSFSISCEINYVENINTKQWKNDIWYSHEDIRSMKEECKKMAEGFWKGKYTEGKDRTSRGLETYLKGYKENRFEVRKNASSAVIRAQQRLRQLEHESDLSLSIARSYRQNGAKQSQIEAYARGQKDVEAMNSTTTWDDENSGKKGKTTDLFQRFHVTKFDDSLAKKVGAAPLQMKMLTKRTKQRILSRIGQIC